MSTFILIGKSFFFYLWCWPDSAAGVRLGVGEPFGVSSFPSEIPGNEQWHQESSYTI